MYGRIFKAFRQINDMSLKEFSSWIGCSTGYLAQLEKGVQKPSDGFLLVALESLKVSEDFFYNLMVYAEIVEEDLKRNSNLTDENRVLFLMQEIKYIILKEQHEKNIQEGFIKNRKILI